MAEAKLERRVTTRAERTYGMAFLPDGKLAVAGGRPGQEGDVCVYDLLAPTTKTMNGVQILDGVNDSKVLIQRLLDIDDAVLCLAVSPDGKKLASGGSNDRLVHVWELGAGSPSAKLEQTIENHADWILGIAFTPDGKRLLTCSRDKTAKVWDLAAKESTLTFPDHQNPVYGLAVKPDGKVAISGGEDNQIRYWNTTGEAKQVLASGGHGGAIFRLVLHPKQPLLVSCSADGTVRTWNSDTGKPVHTLKGHTDWIYALALSRDGNLIASGSYNGEVKIWKVADGTLVKAFIGSPGFEQTAAKGKK
jgi:WD40 repeat protein